MSDNTDNSNISEPLISMRGLHGYAIFLLIIVAAYTYLQLNGILIYNSTQTEHEGNTHTNRSYHK